MELGSERHRWGAESGRPALPLPTCALDDPRAPRAATLGHPLRPAMSKRLPKRVGLRRSRIVRTERMGGLGRDAPLARARAGAGPRAVLLVASCETRVIEAARPAFLCGRSRAGRVELVRRRHRRPGCAPEQRRVRSPPKSESTGPITSSSPATSSGRRELKGRRDDWVGPGPATSFLRPTLL